MNENREKERCIRVVKIVFIVLVAYAIGDKVVQNIPHWLDNYEDAWRRQFSMKNFRDLSYSDMVDRVGKPAYTRSLDGDEVCYTFYPYSKLGPMWGCMVKLRGYPTTLVIFKDDRCMAVLGKEGELRTD